MSNEKLYRKTPLMGWASWNCFRTNISEEILKKQADALVATGLAEHGYEYFNIDDGFFGGRNEEGKVITHSERFPNGLKVLADYAHSLGLKAGTYSEAGDNTCGFYYDNEGDNGRGVGLYGHEEQDLTMYLTDWNFDFIKVDWCGGLRMGLDEEEQYTKISRIIDRIRQEQNRCIVYNICRWQFPGEWAVDKADSWRTGGDISPNFQSVLYQIDSIKPLRKYCSPGHVNDLDMMQVGNGMSPCEDEAHFAMWCMMSTPLMLGCDLTKISQETIKLITNDELIAINQDKACLQAFVAKEFYDENTLAAEIWVKDLGRKDSASKAIAFLNRSEKKMSMDAHITELGLDGSADKIKVRNLMKHEDEAYEGRLCMEVEPHSCVVLCVTAEKAVPVKDCSEAEADSSIVARLQREEAMKLVSEGAVLVDVRETEQFEASHEENAINIPYTSIQDAADRIFGNNRELKIVLYCNTGKKCNQAAESLKYLGYSDISYYTLFQAETRD